MRIYVENRWNIISRIVRHGEYVYKFSSSRMYFAILKIVLAKIISSFGFASIMVLRNWALAYDVLTCRETGLRAEEQQNATETGQVAQIHSRE